MGVCHVSGLPIAAVSSFTSGPTNQACAHSPADVQAAAVRLRASPKPLPRPVLIFSGYRVPGLFGGQLATRLSRLTTGNLDDFRLFAYPWAGNLESLVNLLAKKVGREYGLIDPQTSIPVDVVGISMGGILGRLAAACQRNRPSGVPRLDIRRLFTIATPHRGAPLALTIHIDQAARDMQPGSAFLKHLDEMNRADDFELVPYASLNDRTVGATNTSPPGSHPIWLPGTPRFAHTTVTMHPAIALDIALRLRGETPIGQPSPVPHD